GEEGTAADYALTAPEDQLFANPGYVEAWQKVLDMKDAGCFQDAPNATSPEATRSMFSAEQFEKIAKSLPLRKVGTGRDIANAAVFLASSNLAGHVTGQVLSASGGYSMVG
ncbi:MAG: SDR family oxidoreductase, partial [Alphaproteobacteria bacterium]|nr:SDR family oxidoreductase [Alphaproteobacteria bacterium]